MFIGGLIVGCCLSLLSIVFFKLFNNNNDPLNGKTYVVQIKTGKLWQQAEVNFKKVSGESK